MKTNQSLSSAFERLSSGLRINHAVDDAASLAVASALGVDGRVYRQALRNINDGISFLSVAEGAVNELKSIVFRVAELSEQSANGVYSGTQRSAMSAEVQSLQAEYSRILDSTSFNGRRVFGESGSVTVQAGYGSQETLTASIGSVANTASTSASWDGTFQAYATFSAGGGTGGLNLADLDGDGDMDAISGGGGSVEIFLGNGDGTFAAPGAITGNGSALAVTVGHFDADSDLDIAVADSLNLSINLSLGNGNGTFNAITAIPGFTFNNTPAAISAVDLNHDDHDDLVIGTNNSSSTDTISVMFGRGDGSFDAAISMAMYVLPHSAQAVLTTDLDNDGNVDIVSSISSAIGVRFGNGNGTFEALAHYTGGGIQVNDLAAADIDSNGMRDIITANGVYLGNSNGTFQTRTNFAGGFNGAAVAAIDLNGDDYVDVARIQTNTSKLEIFLGNGDGTFRARISTPSATIIGLPAGLEIADLNGDGVYDFAAAGLSGTNTLGINVSGATAAAPSSGAIVRLSGMDVSTAAAAREALNSTASVLDSLNTAAGNIGSSVSRFQIALRAITTRGENFEAAASAIMDADVAAESASLVRQQILQQTGAAVLAQANQQPAMALSLLRTAG